MYRDQIRGITLAALMIASVVTAGVGTVSAASDTEVSVAPGGSSVDVGSTQTFDVVVDSGSDGSQGYNFTVQLSNGSVGNITDAETAGSPGLEDTTRISEDNNSVRIIGGYFNALSGAEPLTIATVTVVGTAAGTTDVKLGSGIEVRDGNNQRYNIVGTNAATLTVTDQQADFEVTNLSVPGAVTQGTEVTATATVTNTGTANGTETVEFRLGGNVVDTTNVALNAGTSQQVSLSANTSNLASGDYTASVTAGDSNVSAQVTIGDTALSVTPANATTGVGSTQTFEVVVDNGAAGSQGYDLVVQLSNGTVGNVTGADTAGNPGLVDQVTISSDNNSVSITGGYTSPLSGAQPLTIATVTVEGTAIGETAVELGSNVQVRDGNNQQYTITTRNAATLAVDSQIQVPGAQGPAQDLDGDGLFEDVDGSGTTDVFDAIALYNNRNAAVVQNNVAAFDFDGDGSVDVFDAIELFNRM